MSDSWVNTLISLGAQFSDGRLTQFSGVTAETSMARTAGICDLSHYGLIKITGDDAGKFLHAQFTNDIASLPSGLSQLNGWCSPKGRLLAVFWIWRVEDAYYLLLRKSLQPMIQKRLGMFILRSKVVLEDLSGTTVRIGLIKVSGAEGAVDIFSGSIPAFGSVATTSNGTSVRLSAFRTVLIAEPNHAPAAWQALCETAQPLTANEWDLAAVNEGIIEVVPDTQDSYVPQMANFELVGGVSFKKGCYPGQEIVARTQYRGILKRRMAKVSSFSSAALKPGTPVYSPQFPDQSVGSVALSARCTAIKVVSLIVTQLEAINHDNLFLDLACLPENKLVIESLPYAYPA
ncbi:MAG: folate-binding protein YgfZ [Aeromicrobium sp.]|nr:folate-binding protein YgfZ [Burkholderiales bacterium]